MDVGDKVVCHQYRLRQIHSVKPHRVSQHAFTSGNPLNPCHPERSREGPALALAVAVAVALALALTVALALALAFLVVIILRQRTA